MTAEDLQAEPETAEEISPLVLWIVAAGLILLGFYLGVPVGMGL